MQINSVALYEDKDSEKMVKERRKRVRRGYGTEVLYSIGMFALLVEIALLDGSQNPEDVFWETVMIVSCFLFPLVAAHYYLVIRTKNVMAKGMALSHESLRIFGKEIPISDILRAEVRWFGMAGHILAIDCYRIVRRKRKITSHYIRESETASIFELGEKLRDLKGWQEQKTFPMSDVDEWKRERRRMLQQAGQS